MKHTSFALLLAMAIVSLAAPAVAQRVTDNSMELEAKAILSRAGYRYDAESLARALYDSDLTVAAIAAGRLSEFPVSPTTLTALQQATQRPEEVVAAIALDTLQRLGAMGWEPRAVELLTGAEDPAVRLDMAGVLARAGRSDGWPPIKTALRGEKPALLANAVTNAAYFQGLKDANGQTIDAVGELERIRTSLGPNAPKVLRTRIDLGMSEAKRRSPQGEQ